MGNIDYIFFILFSNIFLKEMLIHLKQNYLISEKRFLQFYLNMKIKIIYLIAKIKYHFLLNTKS